MSFEIVENFENKIAEFFGSPYAVAVDSCTHGLELCLRYTNAFEIEVPNHTYISVPFLADKLYLKRIWKDIEWEDYYFITENIVDAAVLWKKNSYVSGTYMCLSFQYQKHLSLGRGGMILLDNKEDYKSLKKMSYDGRLPNIPWRDQDIEVVGYHYYMTPETAKLGLEKLDSAIISQPRKWVISDWPDLTKMKVFNE